MSPQSARRPQPPRRAGVVACLAGTALLVTSCGGDGPVEVSTPRLGAAESAVCAALVQALPDTVDGAQRRQVEPAGAPAAAWGDPPIVLRCGVPMPEEYDDFATCHETNDVGWFIPDEQVTGSPEAITMTTIGREVNIEVALPVEHFPPASAMVDLADAVKQTTQELDGCV